MNDMSTNKIILPNPLDETKDKFRLEATAKFNADNPLTVQDVDIRSKFTTMPEPVSDPFALVSHWLYKDMMTDPHRDAAILFSWLLLAAFSGRKDSLKKNPPVFQFTATAINGFGKDVVRKALSAILQGLRQRFEQDNDQGPDLEKLGALRCFEHIGRAFGTKAMIKQELNLLSTLSILSEAGINKNSSAGDSASVQAALMQNFAQDAYSRRTYAALAEGLPMPHGPNVSFYQESTNETYIAHRASQVGSGETARELAFRLDVSRQGRPQLHDDALPPEHILDIFEVLFMEAIRGEDFTTSYGEGRSAVPAVALKPVPEELKRRFDFDEEAEQVVESWLDHRYAVRTGNTENTADLAWAHETRRIQLCLRMALVHRRVNAICGPEQYHPRATVVGVQDLQIAEAIYNESRRTEQANAGDYIDTPIDRLVESMHTYAIKQLTKAKPSGTYAKKMGNDYNNHFAERRLNSSMFTGAGKIEPVMFAKELVDAGEYKTKADAMEKAAKEGDSKGLWKYERAGTKWAISKVRAS
jgi:hypothetical protein